MADDFFILKTEWEKLLKALLAEYTILAPVFEGSSPDYIVLNTDNISSICYHQAKPVTPLKSLFLPVRENLDEINDLKPRIILGVPACDLAALDLLDEIYLDEKWADPFYMQKRDSTLLIGTDCYQFQEHCHCISSGLNPYPEKNHDLSLSVLDDRVYLNAGSDKGVEFLGMLKTRTEFKSLNEELKVMVSAKREYTKKLLSAQNSDLPDPAKFGELIMQSEDSLWEKYARDCVSCGACAAICPTCTCFLLVDRPDFVKVRQLDSCQYPGFARVAAGEDPLAGKEARFKNRYMCKYVWKPEKFQSAACTGCGRCIDTCIGKLNKNELIYELIN